MINNFQRSNYFLMLATGAMLIGFAPIFVKWSELSPSSIMFYRMVFTLPFLFILNFYLNKKISFRRIKANPANVRAPPKPSRNRICPTGNADETSFITLSSTANVAIATTIKKLPRKFSFWMLLIGKMVRPDLVEAVFGKLKLLNRRAQQTLES